MKKTNTNGQEIGILQLLKMADHHNVIVDGGKKKNTNETVYISFLSSFKLNCFSLLCSTTWGGKEGETAFNYARSSWYSKQMETAVVISSPSFVWTNYKGKDLHTLLGRLHANFMFSRWGLCSTVLNVPLAKGEVCFFEGQKENGRKARPGRQNIPFLSYILPSLTKDRSSKCLPKLLENT